MIGMKGLELELGKNVDISYKLHPYNQCKNCNVFVELMQDGDLNVFKEQINSLNSVISDNIALSSRFSDFIKTQSRNYWVWFSPYSNRLCQALCRRHLLPTFLSKKKKKQIINMLRCESHRDISVNVLK